jgi:predicted PurR-regulated permease PerM
VSTADDRSTARRTLIVIGLVLATLLGLGLVWEIRRVLIWLVVAAFFAVALNPLVEWVQRRLVRRRPAATLLVFLATFVALAALGVLIVVPLLDELATFVHRAPDLLREAQAGHGRVGELLERFHLRHYAQTHADQFQRFGSQLGKSSVGLVRGAAQGIAGVLTILVLAYLMVVEASRITAGTLRLAGDARADRLRRIGRESSHTITGYVSGNLLISLICGLLTFVVLLLTGVPFAAVFALLVAIADLIPMVGATLGAIIVGVAGFVHSTTAGIVLLVYFVIYQQVENHLLQPLIYSRTVRLNPLTVLVSVLIAADLGGLVGALLAIPAAGIVQILLREFIPTNRQPGPADGAGDDRTKQPAG